MYPEMDKKLVEELNKKTLLTPHNLNNGKVIIQSFSLNSLTNIHKLNENIPLIKLVYDKDINKLNNKKLKKLSKLVYGIGINHKMVNKSLIKRAHDNGLKVHVFTLNNKKEVNEMRKLEVDGGFTNNL